MVVWARVKWDGCFDYLALVIDDDDAAIPPPGATVIADKPAAETGA